MMASKAELSFKLMEVETGHISLVATFGTFEKGEGVETPVGHGAEMFGRTKYSASRRD